MACECAVCYGESGPFQKLCCGHTFCKGCIKEWYLRGASGANTTCPLCRSPVYWSGFHRVKDEWNREAYENKCADVFSEALDTAFVEAQEFAEEFPPRWRQRIFRDVIDDFMEIEKTYNVLKFEGASADEIDEVFYWGDYFSDRHLTKGWWADEPTKEWVSKYPVQTSPERCGKRQRAFADEWVTLSVVLLI
jgi:hypothetical protein